VLKLYDALGRKGATRVDEMQDGGAKTIHWNAAYFASEVYISKLTVWNLVETKKLLSLK
jgi:hypothetical protein